MWLYNRVMSPNDADGMANSVDPDQTAPLGAVWSGSALFAQAYLSENLGSLRYSRFITPSLFVMIIEEQSVFLYSTPWTFQDGTFPRFSHIAAMHSDLVAIGTNGQLFSWKWNDYEPYKHPEVIHVHWNQVTVEQIRWVFVDNWRLIFVSSP